jgi:hypothetical protein
MANRREDSTYDRKGARYIPGPPKSLAPTDQFKIDAHVPDLPSVGGFWSWAFSDLKENTTRGVLAEFLVASALGIVGDVKAAWEPYDLKTYSGIRIEVKASGYLQAWSTLKHSTINFSSLKGRVFNSETGDYSEEPSYNADVYIFCKHHAEQHAKYDVLDLDQWEFYVITREYLEGLGHKSVTEKRLIKDGICSVPYHQLRSEFDTVCGGNRSANRQNSRAEFGLWGATSSTGWDEQTIQDYLSSAAPSFEIAAFKALLDFAVQKADKIEPSNGVRPGFSFRIARPGDRELVTIWTIRGYGPVRPLRLELAWGFIRDGYDGYHQSDKKFQTVLNELGGAFEQVEINGDWPILGELSPKDVTNFQSAVIDFVGPSSATSSSSTRSVKPAKVEWSEDKIVQGVEATEPRSSKGSIRVIEWAHAKNLRFKYGTGREDGSLYFMRDTDDGPHYTIILWTKSGLSIPFGDIAKGRIFSNESNFDELRAKLNLVLDNTDKLPEQLTNRWITIGLEYLTDPLKLERLLTVWDWYLLMIDSGDSTTQA